MGNYASSFGLQANLLPAQANLSSKGIQFDQVLECKKSKAQIQENLPTAPANGNKDNVGGVLRGFAEHNACVSRCLEMFHNSLQIRLLLPVC